MDLKTNVSKTGNPLTEPGDTAEEEGSRGVAGKGERGQAEGRWPSPQFSKKGPGPSQSHLWPARQH